MPEQAADSSPRFVAICGQEMILRELYGRCGKIKTRNQYEVSRLLHCLCASFRSIYPCLATVQTDVNYQPPIVRPGRRVRRNNHIGLSPEHRAPVTVVAEVATQDFTE